MTRQFNIMTRYKSKVSSDMYRHNATVYESAPHSLHRTTITHVSIVAAWLIGNTLVSINVVALHRARLVLGWVTVCGRVIHLSM